MFVGTRHRQAQSAGPPAFGLMSVIALLALACFPVLAQAEDSSGVQYSDAIPRAEGDNSSTKQKQPVARSADTDNGGALAPNAKSAPGESKDRMDGSAEDESSEKDGGGAGSGKDVGTGQGNPGGSANGAGKAEVQPGGQTKGTQASEQSADGSSPLVPILIAVVILAAISLAVVMIRQRRQGAPTSPASEAG